MKRRINPAATNSKKANIFDNTKKTKGKENYEKQGIKVAVIDTNGHSDVERSRWTDRGLGG